MEYADTEPLREFARRRGFSPTTVYGWSDKGLIKTFSWGAGGMLSFLLTERSSNV